MAVSDISKLKKGMAMPSQFSQVEPPKQVSLVLSKNDIDLIFDMLTIDEVAVQPFLKLLNAPNQNLRRAHVAALKVKLEQAFPRVGNGPSS